MPAALGAVILTAIRFALVWIFRTALPFLWRSVILRVLQFVWSFFILKPVQWFLLVISFTWRYILIFLRAIAIKPTFWLLFSLGHLLLMFSAFFKWAFLLLFAVVLIKVLDVFGINIFAVIFDYLILTFSIVLDFVITLIFGMINFEEIVGFVNEHLNALPDCVLAVMFAVGLAEALNSMIASAILLVTLRFALFVIRR